MNNTFPKVSLIYDRRNQATENKKSSVEIRITYNQKQKYISTGISLLPNQWKNEVVNRPDALQLNQILNKQLMDVRQIIMEMQEEGNINIFSIGERIKKKTLTFIEFCKQRASIRKYGKTKDSQERYNRFMKYFKKWGKIKTFEDITEENIILYDKYLKKKGMKNYSKWNNYHRFVNSFILDAIDAGYLKHNPYKYINIEKDKSTKGINKYLTSEEFHRIKYSSMPTKSLERVRDLFIFQTYTCLSYADLKEFDYKYVQEVKEVKVYVGRRRKTNMTFTIPLLSPAIDILHKYEGNLPIISNVKYNEYLKVVAQSAKIDKPISSHWARHTGATMLLNEGVPMQIVSKICGHSSIKITEQVYAKLLDETVVDAIKKLT